MSETNTQEAEFEKEREYLRSLVLALYRVTAKLPDDDLLRMKLREESLNVISHAEHLYTGHRERYKKFVTSVQTLIHYCEIAEQEHWVDSKNFSVLKHAFFDVRNIFESNSIGATALPPVPPALEPDLSVSTFAEIAESLKNSGEDTESAPDNRAVSKTGGAKIKKTSANASSAPKPARQETKLSRRQKKILEYCTKKEEAQMADLAGLFPNITKRTIRRDLDSLQKANLIQKEGKTNGAVYRIQEA